MNQYKDKESFKGFDEKYIQEHQNDLSKIKNKIWLDIESNILVRQSPFKLITISKYAATLVLGLLIGYFFNKKFSNNNSDTLVKTESNVIEKSSYHINPQNNDTTLTADNISQIAIPDKKEKIIAKEKTTKSKQEIHSRSDDPYQVNNTAQEPNEINEIISHQTTKPITKEIPSQNPNNKYPKGHLVHIYDIATPHNYTAQNPTEKLNKIHKNTQTLQPSQIINLKSSKL